MPDVPDFTIFPFREQKLVTWQQVVELIDRHRGRFLEPLSGASRSGPRDDVTPFVAVSDAGELLGHAWMDAGDLRMWHVYYLSMVCVREENRRRGIARALLTAAISAHRSLNSCAIESDIERKNTEMIGLVRDLGFSSKGKTPRIYCLY